MGSEKSERDGVCPVYNYKLIIFYSVVYKKNDEPVVLNSFFITLRIISI